MSVNPEQRKAVLRHPLVQKYLKGAPLPPGQRSFVESLLASIEPTGCGSHLPNQPMTGDRKSRSEMLCETLLAAERGFVGSLRKRWLLLLLGIPGWLVLGGLTAMEMKANMGRVSPVTSGVVNPTHAGESS